MDGKETALTYYYHYADYWNYLSANYWLIDAGMMSDMARATGRDAEKYEAMAALAKQYILDRCV